MPSLYSHLLDEALQPKFAVPQGYDIKVCNIFGINYLPDWRIIGHRLLRRSLVRSEWEWTTRVV